jgi:plastocyanin
MERQGIRRGTLAAVLLALVAGLTLVPAVAGASGGGGCGGPVTDEAGTAVEISEYCFTPTILRADVGDVITFTNADRVPHTVLGANGVWGSYDAMKRNVEATYEFAEAGVYPYVCTWHPGMIGVVVVGDGAGGAIDTTTADGPVALAGSQTELASSTSGDGFGGLGIGLAAGGAGLALGAAGALAVRRLRRRSVA